MFRLATAFDWRQSLIGDSPVLPLADGHIFAGGNTALQANIRTAQDDTL
jgi:hypothetical protein